MFGVTFTAQHVEVVVQILTECYGYGLSIGIEGAYKRVGRSDKVTEFHLVLVIGETDNDIELRRQAIGIFTYTGGYKRIGSCQLVNSRRRHFLGCRGSRDVDGFAGGIVINGESGIVDDNLGGRFYRHVHLAGDVPVSYRLSGDNDAAIGLVVGGLESSIDTPHAGNGEGIFTAGSIGSDGKVEVGVAGCRFGVVGGHGPERRHVEIISIGSYQRVGAQHIGQRYIYLHGLGKSGSTKKYCIAEERSNAEYGIGREASVGVHREGERALFGVTFTAQHVEVVVQILTECYGYGLSIGIEGAYKRVGRSDKVTEFHLVLVIGETDNDIELRSQATGIFTYTGGYERIGPGQVIERNGCLCGACREGKQGHSHKRKQCFEGVLFLHTQKFKMLRVLF